MAGPTPFVTIDEAKRWLDLDPADTSRDDILQLLIEAASESLFALLGWDFRRQTWIEIYNGRGGSQLAVNQHPIIVVNSLTLQPAIPFSAPYPQPLEASQYSWDETLVYLRAGTFPRGPKLITINYDAGLSVTPSWAKLAAQFTVKAMWQARKTDMNSTSEQFTGIGGSGFWSSGPGSVPPQARSLLEPHVDRLKVSG